MHLRMIALLSVLALTTGASGVENTDYRFSFGTGTPPAGFTQVNVDTMYTVERGYGFEPSTNLPTPGQGTMPIVAPALQAGESLISSDRTFLFSAAVPEGNYRVTLTLGDPDADCTTTVKAEARRLMLEHLTIPKGNQITKSFVVHVRRPQVRPGVTVKLDPREGGSFTWDDKLSLQLSGAHTALRQLEIHKADDVLTVCLCSDSTVTDQPIEPYGGWGQMLPRWFNDKVAVANYAESGQTLKAFQRQRRWDKVLSLLKRGDYVFMQFGNNDMQSRGHNALWPADDHDEDWSATFSDPNTDYQDILKDWSAQVKAQGAIPVIVSPYTKARRGEPDPAGLRTYPAAAEKAAKDSNTPFLNLTAISTAVLSALGPQVGGQAYVDGQHTTSYGAYLNARSVAFGIKGLKLDLAKYLTGDAVFDPRNPLPLRADFAVPLEPVPGRGGPGGMRGFGGPGPGGGPSTPPTGN